jgi:hypothetical protein
MDLVKQYIVQCIVTAANNLRLSPEKIEVVALLREEIMHAEDLEKLIPEMKKVTTLSTFAIKLGEIYNYLVKGKVDFLKLSDKFKEHGSFIVQELNNILEKISPQSFRQVSAEIAEHLAPSIKKEESIEPTVEKKGLIVEEIKKVPLEKETKNEKKEPGNEKLKEEFILDIEEKNEEIQFEKYEERILSPIKSIDKFLKELTPDRINEVDLDTYYMVMEKNAEISSRIGFDIIANMHSIFAKSLSLIKSKTIMPVKEVIEGMRACLIVIVAVVRGKEVDITNYLNRAENFGRQIQDLN